MGEARKPVDPAALADAWNAARTNAEVEIAGDAMASFLRSLEDRGVAHGEDSFGYALEFPEAELLPSDAGKRVFVQGVSDD